MLSFKLTTLLTIAGVSFGLAGCGARADLKAPCSPDDDTPVAQAAPLSFAQSDTVADSQMPFRRLDQFEHCGPMKPIGGY
jgi:hypothetical protein